ncbi:MAG: hypothetical protein KF833_14410 [Verrucomicrobiae bacterium]|nr:hypothetical protein [Verrucomicrobiae bacterium]
MTGFTGLVWLGLNFNRIETLPGSIGNLTNLQRLYLRGNALTKLPDRIGDLRSLVELDITGCETASLPAAMARLEALEHVGLDEKSLAPDLRAVWKEEGWKSLREHLGRAAEEVSVTQCVGKVVLVGPQENGKTCLQRALRGEPFQAGGESTDGMSRERLHLGLTGDFVTLAERARKSGPRMDVIDLTLWDMGGQEHYQHTHQMFFTPSALYLVVTMPRQGASVQKLHEWIELVGRRTGGDATVIVVSTRCNDKDCQPDKALTLQELQSRHGEMIRAMVAVDSRDGTGIPEMRVLLATVAQEKRSKCTHTWLPGWAKVLDELSNSGVAFLRWRQISDICARHGIGEAQEQRQVIRTGHYIGALLWREDIPAGEDVVILNPDWLCRAVARLVDDEHTRLAHGLVDILKLERVWRGPGRDNTPGYEPDTYEALIELMEINELAYRPRMAGAKTGQGHQLLVTQMVEDRPRHDVDTTWTDISPPNGAEAVRVIAFRKVGSIGYEEVPDIIYLLIFRLREFSLGRADYNKALHWQRGLLVTDDYGSAGKIELDGPLLRITVRHRLGDGLMHSIVHRIGVRGDGYWSGLGLEKVEFVPCGRVCAVGKPDSGLISMEDCAEADRAGNRSVRCETCKKYVSIRELLSLRAVVPPVLEALTTRVAEMEANLAAVIREEGAATREDIASLREVIQMQGDGILDAFTSEWKDGPRLFSVIPVPGEKGEVWWRPNLERWTHMTFRMTVWCEASRRPVPLFRELKDQKDEGRGFKGSETITLPGEWLQGVRRALTWGSWATLALTAGGAGAIGGLVTAAGGLIEPQDARNLAAEVSRQRGVIKEVAAAIPDHSRRLLLDRKGALEATQPEMFGSTGSLGFGKLVEEDLKLIRFLREEFKRKDPAWGGLRPRNDGKFGRIWAHPKA